MTAAPFSSTVRAMSDSIPLGSVVDPKRGSVGEWLFAPSPDRVPASRPLADGLLALADIVLPVFVGDAAQPGVFRVSGVALRPIGGPDDTFPTLAATMAAVDAKETSLPTSEASIEVYCDFLAKTDAIEHAPIPLGATIAWRWIGEPVIQVKLYTDIVLPKFLDGSTNLHAEPNRVRLAAALTTLAERLGGTVELGDDEMPWTRADGFYLVPRA